MEGQVEGDLALCGTITERSERALDLGCGQMTRVAAAWAGTELLEQRTGEGEGHGGQPPGLQTLDLLLGVVLLPLHQRGCLQSLVKEGVAHTHFMMTRAAGLCQGNTILRISAQRTSGRCDTEDNRRLSQRWRAVLRELQLFHATVATLLF